jgi:hypothetical protein
MPALAPRDPANAATVMAPDPFVAPYYSFLLERTPKAQPAEPVLGGRTSTRTDTAATLGNRDNLVPARPQSPKARVDAWVGLKFASGSHKTSS